MNKESSRNRLKRELFGPQGNGKTHSPDHNGGPSATANKNGHARRAVLITGGAGFIGTNLAHRLLSAGTPVILYDNLSRPGVEQNLSWLRATHGDLVELERADIRDYDTLRSVVRRASQVFHFAAQVAVTTSLTSPFEDFEINARGTLNLLEALRSLAEPPPLVFTSTNKVYGDLNDVPLRVNQRRYEPVDDQLRARGFDESRPLHFHSPYGCSKGAACQYVQDYARTFGLRTVVFRMSCIYGPHQFGTEDQGWVAHFLIKALEGSPITIYGDGRQVRDVLFVEDLVDAFLLAQKHIHTVSGRAFNLGGGAGRTLSLLELLDLIGELHGRKPQASFAEWRPADQQYYVSDIRAFSEATGWLPRVDVRAGVAKLYHWLREFGQSAAGQRVQSGATAARRNGQPALIAAPAVPAGGTANGKTVRARRFQNPPNVVLIPRGRKLAKAL
jgi:CDP-paratose 2-epimerase